MWANLGLMEHEGGDYAEAIKSFQHAIRLKPGLYVPNLFTGIDSLQTGNTNQAVQFLVKAERMNKTDPEASLELGRAYSAAGKFPAAAGAFGRAIELDLGRSDRAPIAERRREGGAFRPLNSAARAASCPQAVLTEPQGP